MTNKPLPLLCSLFSVSRRRFLRPWLTQQIGEHLLLLSLLQQQKPPKTTGQLQQQRQQVALSHCPNHVSASEPKLKLNNRQELDFEWTKTMENNDSFIIKPLISIVAREGAEQALSCSLLCSTLNSQLSTMNAR